MQPAPPNAPRTAPRGGSTGQMTPLAAIREARAAHPDAPANDAEILAGRVLALSDLFNPDFTCEWLRGRTPEDLSAAADLVESLGAPEVAQMLREHEPVRRMLWHYDDLDEDPPADAPEFRRLNELWNRMDEIGAWGQVVSGANQRLDRSYPWAGDS